MSQIAIVTKCDSFMGKVVFNWTKQMFKQLMESLDFIDLKKNGQYSYFKKVQIPKSQKQCTLVAYGNGTMVLNGCQDLIEMESVLEEFINRLPKKENMNIKIVQRLKITSSRSITKLCRLIDVQKIQKDVFANLGQKKKDIQYHLKNKVYIPEQMHRYKNVKIFVNLTGCIQISKAHLIPNLNSFVRKFSQFLINNYSKQDKQEVNQQSFSHSRSLQFPGKQKSIKKQTNIKKDQPSQKKHKGEISSYNKYELQDEQKSLQNCDQF